MIEQTTPWRGRRVLVTGVSGFLGGAVARELLTCGAEVVGLIHHHYATPPATTKHDGRMRFVHGRADNVFRLHSAMAVYEVSAVFHLASCDTSALIQAVKLYSSRVPVVTARPIQNLMIARTEETQEQRLSVVRFGEVFGPGDRKIGRVVPATAREALHGNPATPADGPARDFVFASDAARACLLAAESAASVGAVDHSFRSGWLMTERQMAAALRDAAASRPVEVPDCAPVSNPLGWQPAQSLADALTETLSWYRTFQTGAADPIRAAA